MTDEEAPGLVEQDTGANDRLDGGSLAIMAHPAPYGLTRAEIRAEVRRLAAAGLQLWELRQMFGHPREWGDHARKAA